MLVKFPQEGWYLGFCPLVCVGVVFYVLNLSSTIQNPLDDKEKGKIIHFVALAFEQVLLVRNKKCLGLPIPDWQQLSLQMNRSLNKY